MRKDGKSSTHEMPFMRLEGLLFAMTNNPKVFAR